jgi:hypothetical protein
VATVSSMATTVREMFESGSIDLPHAVRYLLLDRQTAVEYTNLWGRPSGAMHEDLRSIDADLNAIVGQPVNADAMMTAAIRRQDYSIIALAPSGVATS